MSLGFSIVHGMCTTPLIYATTLLGSHDGDVANGTLYITNVLSSLLFSVVVVRATGLKGGLLVCMSLYALYVGFFASVLYFEDRLPEESRVYAAIPSSVCGGLAFAIGWTAQGGFFARSATLISQAEGRPRERVSVDLAGRFAMCYLIFELLGKAGFSLLQRVALLEPVTIFAGYCVLSVVVIVVTAVALERLDASAANADRSCARKLCDTVVLWRHPRLWLLSPTNFAFGFAAAYMNGRINSLFAEVSGLGAVGIMSAVTTGTSACLVQLYGPLSLSVGKGTVLGLGALSFFSIPLITFLLIGSNPDNIHILVFLYVLQGSGRAVYESTNKAIISDAFQGAYSESAFANSFVQLSLAASACFFLAGVLNTDSISVLLMSLSALMLPCYKLVQVVTQVRARRRQLDPANEGEVEMGDSFIHC